MWHRGYNPEFHSQPRQFARTPPLPDDRVPQESPNSESASTPPEAVAPSSLASADSIRPLLTPTGVAKASRHPEGVSTGESLPGAVPNPSYVPKVAKLVTRRQTDQRKAEEEATSRGEGLLRQLIESVACLAMAVIFFRAFILEGYIISTGSMAPHLLGYHKRIQCPDCEFEFAFGTAFDQAVPTSSRARCPNCGQDNINTAKVPRNDGDQLLVFKYAYLNSDPDRWEIVVFLNPADPTQAYVKRLVGRPGETVEVYDGDVLIDGRLARKPIEIQRATRIAVFDHDHPADREDWLPRWQTDGQWSRSGRKFILSNGSEPGEAVSRLPSGPVRMLDAAEPPPFESIDESVTATGSGEWNWCRYLNRPRHVGRKSNHQVTVDPVEVVPDPIADRYGYNQFTRVTHDEAVHDLMWSGRVKLGQSGQFSVVIHNRDRWGVCVLDIDRARLDTWIVETDDLDRLFDSPHFKPHRSVPLRGEWMSPEIDLEVSCFDYQLCVAVNDKSLIEQPFETAGRTPGETSPSGLSSDPEAVAGFRAENNGAGRSPIEQTSFRSESSSTEDAPSSIHFGGRNGTFLVSNLTIFRDVHYISTPGGHAVGKPCSLGDDEFFFLGDNSPVSLDSRGWKDPVVPRRLIVGKPVIVHLPSRPGRIRIGSREWFFRVPDFSRIRYIR